jgi:hypothetical protein
MLVILSAFGGLLESDIREIRMCGNRYQVVVLDMEIDYWKNTPGKLPNVRTATFEHRGKYRQLNDRTVKILELVEYPERV